MQHNQFLLFSHDMLSLGSDTVKPLGSMRVSLGISFFPLQVTSFDDINFLRELRDMSESEDKQ